jgi:L-alanine-DL-glutamate epimerase-like enolase superfamily enzyme
MHIRSIEPFAVSLPMVKPLIMAGEEARRAENMLVRIASADEQIGWGEAAAAPTMTGETVAGMVAAVHYLAPVLIGRDAADIAGAVKAMHGRMYANHGAKAAIEIALHDLLGRATGRPVHALIGNKRCSRLPLMSPIGGSDVDDDARAAALKKGFRHYGLQDQGWDRYARA